MCKTNKCTRLAEAQTRTFYTDSCARHAQNNDTAKVQREDFSQPMSDLQCLDANMLNLPEDGKEATILVSADGLIAATNAAFDRQLGYEHRALVGQYIRVIVGAPFRDLVTAALAVVRQHKKPQRLNIVIFNVNGEQDEIEMTLTHAPVDGDRVICTFSHERRAKAINRMRDHFISTVNHEIRNPLANIMLNAQMLEKYHDQLSQQQRLKKIRAINNQAQIMNDLTDSILEMARLEARYERPTHRVDMAQVMMEVVHEQKAHLESKHHHIDILMDEQDMIVPGNRMDFARVWRNLLDNAIKYTPEYGKIWLRLGHVYHAPERDGQSLFADTIDIAALPNIALIQGNYLFGQVEDTGYGLDEEDSKRLFSRFQRGWAKQSAIPGTGLGLALVRMILRQYDGDICVMSEKGVGSVFTFWVPIDGQTRDKNIIY